MKEIVTAALLLSGATFMLLAGVGVVRLPDLFTRMQASTKAAALGAGCMLLGVAVHFGDSDVTVRALLIVAFILLTSPISAHMIARSAYIASVPLWEGSVRDELRERYSEVASGEEGEGREGEGC